MFSDYLDRAMRQANYNQLEDASFVGWIPSCTGVIAFSNTLAFCEQELHSVLEDWLLVGLRLQHPLPLIDGINLNHAASCS